MELYTLLNNLTKIEGKKSWAILEDRANLWMIVKHNKSLINKERTGNRSFNCNPYQKKINFVRYTSIMDRIYRSGGLKIHGSGVKTRNGGYLFIGQSGAGKTTIIGLAGKDNLILDDDVIIVVKDNARFVMFGPLFKKGNSTFPRLVTKQCELKKIFILRKSNRNRAILLKPQDALVNIMKHSKWHYRLDTPEGKSFLKTCKELIKTVPAYILEFLPTSGVWKYLDKEVKHFP